ncbi:MAG: alkaline phosphatase family protein [Candidatus Limnocylindrales bacterium]
MDRVDHIVALVLENRSFDHLLGDSGRSGRLPVDGGSSDLVNVDLNGRSVAMSPVSFAITPDLPHDFESVAISLMESNGGFVRADQFDHGGDPLARPDRVMSYYVHGTLPVTHRLAEAYTVCDAWFASVPAGTWPNRLFLVAGSSAGSVRNTVSPVLYDLPTVFDRLPSPDWVVYNDQIPNVALIRALALEWARNRVTGDHFRGVRQFEEDCANDQLPGLSFIEPIYLGKNANDGHPPRDITASEHLIARVYRALRRSPAWTRSLLLIFYDEHGGFFDHVPPPVDVPSPGTGDYGFEFSRLGVRVPCLIVSPFAPAGVAWRPPQAAFADHTSLIATVLRKFEREPLTARDAAAADVWSALTLDSPRTDDETTIADLETWLDQQRINATRQFGPLPDSGLDLRTGREMAAAIVAEAGPLPSQPGFRTAMTTNVPAATGGEWRDLPLDRAIVDLASNILALPM